MTEAEFIGKTFDDRYEIRRRLGEGGMAVAYLAWDLRVRLEVVIKVPRPDRFRSEADRERFAREVRRLAELRHANIVRILDVGEVESLPYLVMEYLDGETLGQRLGREGSQDLDQVDGWLRPIADALDHVHRNGILHRDVKPANILFNSAGRVFLADFGLSKVLGPGEETLTDSGVYPGSPAYMPPDVLTGEENPRYDQYSLAATLLHALTGRPPPALAAHKVAAEARLDQLSLRSRTALRKALSVDPAGRFGSCRIFAEAFLADPDGEVGETRTDSPAPAAVRPDDGVAGGWQEALRSAGRAARGWRGARAPGELPVVAVLDGPESDGGAILTRSGFELQREEVSSSERADVRSNLWVGSEGVFLEAGSAEPSSTEWREMVDALREVLGGRPLDSVVVAVSASQLLAADKADLRSRAESLRGCLDDLMKELGQSLPAWIVVTRCERIPGFEAFFGALGHRCRDELCGWAEPAVESKSYEPTRFDLRFNRLEARIYEMRSLVLSHARREDLPTAHRLPDEFAKLRSSLGKLHRGLFRPGFARVTPECRGVYFGSSGATGDSVPLFVESLLERTVLERTETGQRRIERARRRCRKTMIGTLSLLAILAVLLARAYFVNSARVGAVSEAGHEGELPLEVAVSLLDSRDATVPPGFLDFGLNHSARVVPALMRSFQTVFGEGCVDPTLDAFWDTAAAGPMNRMVADRAVPDIWQYLESYRHFIYYRQALQGRLDPGKKDWDKDWEKEHLDYLFKVLTDKRAAVSSESTPADMRRSLVEYGRSTRIELQAPRLDEIGEMFDRHLMGWLKRLEEWITRTEGLEIKVEQDFDRSFQAIKEACLRNKVIPHDRPERVAEVARTLYDAAYPSRDYRSGSEGPGLADLTYGAVTVGEVRKYMTSAKEIARDDGPVPPMVDDLLARLGKERSTDQVQKLQQAQQSFLGYLDGIINERIPETPYDSIPTREGLELQRDRISRDIQNSANLAWDRVKVPVLVVESRADTVMDPTTGMLKAGWWDTLIDLSRAKTADVLQAEYLSKGLTPFLKGPQWRTKALGEDPAEILTKDRLQDLIHVEFMNQRGFFGKPELARSIAGNADGEMREAIDSFVGDMEKFWVARLKSAIPPSPGTLEDLYKHVDMWSNTHGDFLITCDDIGGAIYGIRRLADDEDEDSIPFLRATQVERARLFDTFAVCFRNVDDRAVQRRLTVATVAADLDPLKQDLERVASGDKSDARRVLADLVQARGGLANPFKKALDVMAALKDEGSGTDSPQALLANWMVPGIRKGQDWLVDLTAEDINEEWIRFRSAWLSRLESGAFEETEAVLGDGGEYPAFRKEYLEPFFAVPGYTPRRKLEGKNLAADPGFAALDGQMTSGMWRPAPITLEVSAGGMAPVSEVRAYHITPRGKLASEPFRSGGPAAAFRFELHPTSDRGLEVEVTFEDGEERKLSWPALLEALRGAVREGDTFVLRQEDRELGSYEIRLTVVAGDRKLAAHLAGEGGDGGNGLQRFFPEQAVRVVE